MTPPEIPCRLAATDEIPRSAHTLMNKAQAAGWTVCATFARGTDIKGRRHKVVDSVAVRLRRGGSSLVALWIDGKFDCALAPFRRMNSHQLKAEVETCD